jgi:hypothetical protein
VSQTTTNVARAAVKPRGSAFASMPRSLRWALVFGLFVAAYFFAVEPAIDKMNAWDAESDQWPSALKNYAKEEAELRAATEAVKLGERQFGDVSPPGQPGKRADEFRDAVNEVLNKHGVTQRTVVDRTGTLQTGPLVDHVKGVARIEKQMSDITFQATPEIFAAVLADFERSPSITNIGRVTVRQSDGKDKVDRLLRITMTVETWMQNAVTKAQ